MKNNTLYCNSLFQSSRFQTRHVSVGDVIIGGDQPIRIQSMTTTDTMDTRGTVEQSIRMIEADCEIVRITAAPSKKEAENLRYIRDELHRHGYPNPFNPITNIRFDEPENSMVTMAIYDLLGHKVRTLINYEMNAGFHSIQWNETNDHGNPLASGMYIYRINAGGFHAVKKLVFMK